MGMCCSCFELFWGSRSNDYLPIKDGLSRRDDSELGYSSVQLAAKDPILTGTVAILLAAKFCRNSHLYKWREETMLNIGRRDCKHNFLIDFLDLRGTTRSVLMMSVIPRGICQLPISNESYIFKIKSTLVALQHPYILPVVDLSYSKERQALIIIRPFVPGGSIKDHIYGKIDPRFSYSHKYQEGKSRILDTTHIALYGRQILEALSFLRSKGIMCQHLSTSNVMIDDETARLSDIENTVLAVDRYQEWIDLTLPLEAERHVDLDLILFGHMLHEMTFGEELKSPIPVYTEFPKIDKHLRQVLDSIFNCGSDEKLTISHLANHPFFNDVEIPVAPSVQLDSQMKGILKDSAKRYTATNVALVQKYNERMIRENEQKTLKNKLNEVVAQKQKEPRGRKSMSKSTNKNRSGYRRSSRGSATSTKGNEGT